MKENFVFDQRLGIYIPDLIKVWDDYTKEDQEEILYQWEKVRGSIPDRIIDLEREINHKQAALSNEGNFERSCQLNSEIADLASIINDLWLWYRADQSLSTSKTHH
ncbi:hypothetical protein [Neobacillus dielmonensis]|uniref:hypothetical protein n=1 Tax=Neobacillus dielmonensis TaxID=1347369 RepID=UPI0005A62BF4|nr:hypothetical protein [Neobacillus dielmonensis]